VLPTTTSVRLTQVKYTRPGCATQWYCNHGDTLHVCACISELKSNAVSRIKYAGQVLGELAHWSFEVGHWCMGPTILSTEKKIMLRILNSNYDG